MIEIFKEVGPVANFRILFDRETGKPKGYGFCEYFDAGTAASAIRNLNNYDLGTRQLRVDYADFDSRTATKRDRPESKNAESPTDATPNVTSVEQITATLGSMDTEQIMEVIVQMKALVASQSDEARELLIANPHLAYALFQSLIMMGLIDPEVIASVIQHSLDEDPSAVE